MIICNNKECPSTKEKTPITPLFTVSLWLLLLPRLPRRPVALLLALELGLAPRERDVAVPDHVLEKGM